MKHDLNENRGKGWFWGIVAIDVVFVGLMAEKRVDLVGRDWGRVVGLVAAAVVVVVEGIAAVVVAIAAIVVVVVAVVVDHAEPVERAIVKPLLSQYRLVAVTN
jgi:hypothetical protein